MFFKYTFNEPVHTEMPDYHAGGEISNPLTVAPIIRYRDSTYCIHRPL